MSQQQQVPRFRMSRKSAAWAAVFCSSIAILAIDAQIELGVAGGVLYVVVIWVASLSRHPRMLWTTAGFCSLLTIAGYFLSPSGGETAKVIANRALALLAIWVSASLSVRFSRHGLLRADSGGRPTLLPIGLPSKTRCRRIQGHTLWVIIGISLAIHVTCLILGDTVLAAFRWPHPPVHSAVEMAGGLVALWVAWLLLNLQRRGIGTSFNVWIAGALIGMGLLDGLHAMVHDGHEFVWLHSMATFVGGLLFVAVWLPRSWGDRAAGWWPLTVAVSVAVFGVFSLLEPDLTPRMLMQNPEGQKVFTGWAIGLNVIGGILLFAAALRIILVWRKTQNVDDLLFFLHCLLFGAAAVMFEQSQLWDLPWWGWHLLRLMAYCVALWFVVLSDQRDAAELRDRSAELSQFSAIVNSSDDAILGQTLDGTIVSWNAGAERLYGYSASEMIGQPVTRLDAPDRKEEMSDLLKRIGRHEPIQHFETERIRRDDSIVYVSLSISPILDNRGNSVGVSTIARDITAKKIAALELSKQREQIDALLNSTAEGIYGIDLEGNCTFANPSCLRMLGYDSDVELLGRNMHEVIHHSQADGTASPEQQCRIFEAFQQGLGVAVDNEVFWRKDGSSIPVDYWSYPLRLNEQLTGAVVTFLDATERRQLQQVQQNMNAMLERQVEERTRDLKRSNADLEQFAYVASHDLQEPLRAVVGYSQLLKMELGDSTGDTFIFLTNIVEGGERMQMLIKDLLAFSRVTRKGAPFAETDMNAIVQDALANLASAILESDAQIKCQSLPVIQGDGPQLRQLLQNLIGNAIKYRGDRTPQIEVSFTEDSVEWDFSVKDNGIGIDPEFHDQVFVIFKRLHTREHYSGTGIGLALCKRIVERHGGSIRIASEANSGSTFHFTIPKHPPTESEDLQSL